MANHPISHLEIPAVNPDAVGTFYRNVFGWKLDTNPEHYYVTFQAEGGLHGGFAGPAEPTYKLDRLLVYLSSLESRRINSSRISEVVVPLSLFFFCCACHQSHNGPLHDEVLDNSAERVHPSMSGGSVLPGLDTNCCTQFQSGLRRLSQYPRSPRTGKSAERTSCQRTERAIGNSSCGSR